MEKVPGHGLCTANRPAGRPARRRNITLPIFTFKIDHSSIFKVEMDIIWRLALIPYFESRSVVDFT